MLLPCVDLSDDGVTSIADDGGGAVGRPVRWLRMGPWSASCQAARCGVTVPVRSAPVSENRCRHGRRRQVSPVARSPTFVGRAERDSSQQPRCQRPRRSQPWPSSARRSRARQSARTARSRSGAGRAAIRSSVCIEQLNATQAWTGCSRRMRPAWVTAPWHPRGVPVWPACCTHRNPPRRGAKESDRSSRPSRLAHGLSALPQHAAVDRNTPGRLVAATVPREVLVHVRAGLVVGLVEQLLPAEFEQVALHDVLQVLAREVVVVGHSGSLRAGHDRVHRPAPPRRSARWPWRALDLVFRILRCGTARRSPLRATAPQASR